MVFIPLTSSQATICSTLWSVPTDFMTTVVVLLLLLTVAVTALIHLTLKGKTDVYRQPQIYPLPISKHLAQSSSFNPAVQPYPSNQSCCPIMLMCESSMMLTFEGPMMLMFESPFVLMFGSSGTWYIYMLGRPAMFMFRLPIEFVFVSSLLKPVSKL